MGKKILVVDDEPDIVKLTGKRLQANGFEVVEAYNGRQALQMANTENPDLILLDIRMPGLGGFAVFEKLKASEGTTQIPVIFMTADLKQETCEQALDLGPEYFLNKPFNPDELLAKIETILERIDREGH